MKMKRHILLTLLALFTVTFAKAQADVHIVNWVYGALVEAPDTINGCPDVNYWTTNVPCDSYTWSRNDDEEGSVNDSLILIVAEHSFTLYLTAVLNDNVYRDSLCFIIKDWITPMEDFQMEVDETGHAVFSGVATSEHSSFFVYRSLDTIHWNLVAHEILSPGPWSWRDADVHFGQDSVWNYSPAIIDTCSVFYYPEMVPGLVLGTQPAPGGGWYLTMKSVLQSNKKEGELRDGEEYVYALYTVDQEGVRHPFRVDGEQVVLPTSTQAYLLPGRHPDEYYQGGVGKLTGGKDGELEILSYSNKVENPLPDLDGLNDNDGNLNGNAHNATNLKVWPNPAQTTLNLEGDGQLTVYDATGRRIMDQSLDGELALTLPSGMYLVRLVNGTLNETLKVVVE